MPDKDVIFERGTFSDIWARAIKEKKALSILQEWDFVADADGIAPTVFHATVNEMVKISFEKRLGDQLYEQYIKNSYVVFNAMRNLMARGQSAWFDDPDTEALLSL